VVEADYTTAITTLTRYSMPSSEGGVRSLVKDAIYLDRNRSLEAGAVLIQAHSGRRPKRQPLENKAPTSSLHQRMPSKTTRVSTVQASPARSPARFSTPQKQLENLFQEVSGGIQRRTEGWNISRAVLGAVGEVRRNVNNLQAPPPQSSIVDGLRPEQREVPGSGNADELEKRLHALQARNKALAMMLDGAMNSLRVSRSSSDRSAAQVEDNFNMALAKIQFVSVYLGDPEIPLPQADEDKATAKDTLVDTADTKEGSGEQDQASPAHANASKVEAQPAMPAALTHAHPPIDHKKSLARPLLADSSFSFMLGENRHRSSFVSSVLDLPEQRRGSESTPVVKPTAKQKHLWADKQDKERKAEESEDDGFTLNSLRGSRRK